MRPRREPDPSFRAVQARLNLAFRLLRRQGVIARQHFSCCRGCAWGEVVTLAGELTDDKAAKLQGCVFYTKQETFTERWGLHLSFGSVEVDRTGMEPLVYGDTLTVGNLTAAALGDAGLAYEWNGTAEHTIRITGLSDGVTAAVLLAGPDAALPARKPRK